MEIGAGLDSKKNVIYHYHIYIHICIYVIYMISVSRCRPCRAGVASGGQRRGDAMQSKGQRHVPRQWRSGGRRLRFVVAGVAGPARRPIVPACSGAAASWEQSELRAHRVCGWEWPSGGEGPGAFGGPTPAEGGGARLTAGRQPPAGNQASRNHRRARPGPRLRCG